MSKSYVLDQGNQEQSEGYFDSDGQAMAWARSVLGSDIIFADDWDITERDDAGIGTGKRLLIWDDEELAQNDSGQHAIAELQTTGNVV